MARVLKEKEYADRRNEILDSAQRLVYTIGYDQMTIQDILDELHISKGAFYHYFDSKQTLLEGLIERLQDEAEANITPILSDPALPALEKFNRYFAAASSWKAGQKEYLIAFTRMWYADENALVRQKVQPALVARFGPIFSRVIRQGIAEGSMSTPYPEQAGSVILNLFTALGDAFVKMLFSPERSKFGRQDYELLFAAYTDAMERVLGAAPGSIQLLDAKTIHEWVEVTL